MAQLDAITQTVPNIPDDAVLNGKDDSENLEVSRWGTPKLMILK